MNTELTILDDAAPDDDAGLHRESDGPCVPADRALRRASVLMPLVHTSEAWHLLFIRRASNERDRHSGQVAFPGGAAEPFDRTPQATALREAHEEIGLEPGHVSLIGRLGDYRTISSFSVTPIVGVVDWPFTLMLQADEVARAFLMPLDWLADAANLTRRARAEMDPATAQRHPIIVYDLFDGETLWGATARMTLNLLKAIDDRSIVLPDVPRTTRY